MESVHPSRDSITSQTAVRLAGGLFRLSSLDEADGQTRSTAWDFNFPEIFLFLAFFVVGVPVLALALALVLVGSDFFCDTGPSEAQPRRR